MENYDYFADVQDDVLEWLDDNHADYGDMDVARDDCETDVTGNGDGSHTFSREAAAAYSREFVFSEEWTDFISYLPDWGTPLDTIMADPETFDVYIRLYVFGQVWNYVTTSIDDWADLDMAALRKAVA
ncbi:hypothetical protein PMR98_06430 [Bifidobacterium longum]|uniref:hypothetical protein n=1 Tax=Bifidobacterium longum TaxID=216816 RepID=UPI00189D6F23|nr:hypothetical protein [Bifidobacterium longum]MDB6598547.1 hypothetical protein [Bifidobacterium longum]MDB6600527.1 hypothetical protein [Bifidobacterium longum]MDB6795147.1 hypothetical protein [Bifidobacterium longum]MDB6797121.1 hypothetical protein [Bifidobacterium longum]MDB6799161.1 hypothetical protein [Bifidobacterium longum]